MASLSTVSALAATKLQLLSRRGHGFHLHPVTESSSPSGEGDRAERGGGVMLSGPVETVRRARKLRRDMSLPEVLLWQKLRKRPAGLKFRRQQPARTFVTDFYCHAAKLVIEVDGEAHERGNAPEWDAERDCKLAVEGVRTLRISAREILDNLEGTVSHIVLQARDRITPPPSCGWSPSPEGEDR